MKHGIAIFLQDLRVIGSFFSGSMIVKAAAHLPKDEAGFSGHSTVDSCRNGFNADAN